MLLKLLIPPYRRSPRGSFVLVKWHKAEGEWVDYGDDLFDVRVEEVLIQKGDNQGWTRDQVKALAGGPAREALRRMEQGEVPACANPEESQRTVRVAAVVRVSAADRGRLRRIHAREGERRQTGDLLAVLSTDGGDPVDEAGAGREQASAFRVNEPVPLMPDELW